MRVRPALIAVVLSLCVVTLAGATTLTATKTTSPPAVDGTADATWDAATATTVKVARIPAGLASVNKEKQKGKYAKNWGKDKFTQIAEVELKALYTTDQIFFLARWKDASQDDQHKPWKWEGPKDSGEYVAGKEREDRLSFMFPISGPLTANMLSGEEATVDVWQWKAARTNSAGIIHDKHHSYTKTQPKGKFSIHYTADGSETYVSRISDGGVSPYKSSDVDPFTYEGNQVAKYIPFVPDAADAADVSAKGVWADGTWTVEIGRALDTGNQDSDSVFDPAAATNMAIAVFDSVGDHFHAVSFPFELAFE